MGALLLILAFGCRTQMVPGSDAVQPVRARQISPEVENFHRAISIQVGWRAYSESEIQADADGNLHVESADSTGLMPAIRIGDPLAEDGIWISMATDDALFGRLIKHTLMTQQPITRPFQEYMAEASCSSCHPGDRIPLRDWWEQR